MENTKKFDIFDLGENSLNLCYSQLKNDKKVLRMYSQDIDKLLNLVDDQKNALKKMNREMTKNILIDSPFCFLKKFEILINLQCSYCDCLLENSQKFFENLKETVEATLTIITNFLTKIHDISETINSKSETFFENNAKVIKSLEEVENIIVDDYLKTTYKLDLNTDKTNIEQLINDCHNLEKTFNDSKEEIKDIVKKYLIEYNSNIKEIKTKMSELNEQNKEDIKNILSIMKENLSVIVDNSITEIDNFDKRKSFEEGYSNYLNYEIKEDELFEGLEGEKYSLKIINNEEKNIKDLEYHKIQNIKNNNNKQFNSITISLDDIYNIVEKIYNYKFELINKEEYNLEIEKQKINIVEMTNKLLGYNYHLHEEIERKIMNENELNDFINIIFAKEDYLIEFLTRLNNYRSTGKLEFPEDLFNVIKIIFNKAADNLLIKDNKKISNCLIILSQTFYVMKDNEKYFLQKELKNKEYFNSVDFWKDSIENSIVSELERFERELRKNSIVLDGKKKEKKLEEILFTKIVSFITCLNGFELNKEKIDNILIPLMNKYNIKEEMKQSIFPLLNVYK